MHLVICLYKISSLGTTYAKSDFSNVGTKSLGQNGYYKFPDGLMIQWGKKTSGTYSGTIYFPSSFYDTNYSLHLTCNNGNTGNDSSWIANYTSVSTSYFGYNNKYQQAANAGSNTASFYWFAIGRWK
ncbi:gp53-like domain-containing protein [Bacteroides faecis]|uniref:gp53-like domain-containing protein n=1 Tax=Bacteroides TaxID=816 RepID=UPI003DA53700